MTRKEKFDQAAREAKAVGVGLILIILLDHFRLWRQPAGNYGMAYALVGHYRLCRYMGFFYCSGNMDREKSIQRFCAG